MAYYTGKDTTDAFIDPEYERLRRDKNLLMKRVEALDRENAKLKVEISANKAKLASFQTLCEAIDKFVVGSFAGYEQDAIEYIKYLYEIAHKWDENIEDTDEFIDFEEDVLEKCD